MGRHIKRLAHGKSAAPASCRPRALQIAYLRVRTLAHAGWHRIVSAVAAISERVQATCASRSEHVIEKLQAGSPPHFEEPTENLSKLLLEYQSLVQTIHSAASPSITVLTSTANKPWTSSAKDCGLSWKPFRRATRGRCPAPRTNGCART